MVMPLLPMLIVTLSNQQGSQKIDQILSDLDTHDIKIYLKKGKSTGLLFTTLLSLKT